MSPPSELSFDEILKFMIAHNGKVTNHELVKHFKVFLMNPDMRDEARNTFKKHVNALAIIKNQNNEKWLILKKKYIPSKENEEASESKVSEAPTVTLPDTSAVANTPQSVPYRPPPPLQLNQDFSILASLQDTTPVLPPAPKTPIEVAHTESKESLVSTPSDDTPPKVHPRRKSADKAGEKRSSIPGLSGPRMSIPNHETSDLNDSLPSTLTSSRSEGMLIENEQKISVKERKQMFNRMASESDVLKSNKLSFNTSNVDEEDRVSLDHKGESDPLDSKQKQWILCAARGEYHALAKMCKENAKLVKTKDPFTVSLPASLVQNILYNVF
ncbi:uncharacterized protein [Epargyreus clarus]|uniref:uncharacterized protein n=1 Tax=Epargyreus clarus TaxID=520877 RepID=UPI003C2D35C5